MSQIGRFGLHVYDTKGTVGTEMTLPVARITAPDGVWVLVWDLIRPLNGGKPSTQRLFNRPLIEFPYPYKFTPQAPGLHTLMFLAWDKNNPPVLAKKRPRHFFHRTYTVLVS
jgi:hypothetical protein